MSVECVPPSRAASRERSVRNAGAAARRRKSAYQNESEILRGKWEDFTRVQQNKPTRRTAAGHYGTCWYYRTRPRDRADRSGGVSKTFYESTRHSNVKIPGCQALNTNSRIIYRKVRKSPLFRLYLGLGFKPEKARGSSL